MTTIDILASLKSINHFQDILNTKKATGKELTGAEKIAGHELKYLNMGAQAVGENGIWRERFGGGLQGAMAMAELLKQRESERITKALLDDHLEKHGGLKDLTALNQKAVSGLNIP